MHKPIITVVLILSLFGCAESRENADNHEVISGQVVDKERQVGNMSIYLFALPEGTTEEAYVRSLSTLNRIYKESNQDKLYQLFKIAEPDQEISLPYALVSGFSRAEHYEYVHDRLHGGGGRKSETEDSLYILHRLILDEDNAVELKAIVSE